MLLLVELATTSTPTPTTSTTSTTEVQRIVGDPLPGWTVLGAGFALLVVILVAGFVAQRHIARTH